MNRYSEKFVDLSFFRILAQNLARKQDSKMARGQFYDYVHALFLFYKMNPKMMRKE